MAAPALAKLGRPCWPDGRFVRRGIDRVATALWFDAVAARVAVVALAFFGSFAKMLLAAAIDQLLSLAANLRLHQVVKNRESAGELGNPEPNRLRRWWSRYCAWEATRAESKADRLTKRAYVSPGCLERPTYTRSGGRLADPPAAAYGDPGGDGPQRPRGADDAGDRRRCSSLLLIKESQTSETQRQLLCPEQPIDFMHR